MKGSVKSGYVDLNMEAVAKFRDFATDAAIGINPHCWRGSVCRQQRWDRCGAFHFALSHFVHGMIRKSTKALRQPRKEKSARFDEARNCPNLIRR